MEKYDGMKILDVPCSYGKHVIMLASKHNCDIFGIDINHIEIDVARYRAEHELDVNEKPLKLKKKPKFMAADMRNFSDILNNFDLIYNWFWSFGYFGDEEDKKVLKEFYNALKPNGILLIHTITKENIMPDYITDWKREILPLKIKGKGYPGGILHFTKVFNPEKSTLHTTWIVMLNNGIILPEHPVVSSVRMYSIDEYISMLKQTGFRKIEVHDSYYPITIFKARK